jgi:biotin carboxyl carrier protein
MQGSVTSVRVKSGDQVSSGQVLATLEAMKMEYPVRAHSEGRIEAVAVSVGDVITAGSMLFRLVASS